MKNPSFSDDAQPEYNPLQRQESGDINDVQRFLLLQRIRRYLLRSIEEMADRLLDKIKDDDHLLHVLAAVDTAKYEELDAMSQTLQSEIEEAKKKPTVTEQKQTTTATAPVQAPTQQHAVQAPVTTQQITASSQAASQQPAANGNFQEMVHKALDALTN